MNKKELIEKIEALPDSAGLIRPKIDKKLVLGLVRKLDEPEKVKVPQFVANWIEKAKCDYSLLGALGLGRPEIYSWLGSGINQDTFARAWLDGYEKEKRYLVKVKGMKRINGCLSNNKELAIWFFGTSGNSKNYRTHHTRKELEEAGFGWVFDCPGIEIEEVVE